MILKATKLLAPLVLTFALIGSATADDAKKRDYIAEARPYLHMSCEALVEAHGEDDKKMEAIVHSMVAVSLINREIDVTKLLADKKDQDAFGVFLEKALTAQCEEDVHSLLMTNVDRAIVYAFAERKGEKE